VTQTTKDVSKLERELELLMEQLPAHFISPSILARIDELEEEIGKLKEGSGLPRRQED
jgi:hypothetical protein